jgi:hypothetical protein
MREREVNDVWGKKRFLLAFLVIASALFWLEVNADIVPTRHDSDSGISLDTLILAGVVVLVIAVLSYLLLRRIRKSGEKNASK